MTEHPASPSGDTWLDDVIRADAGAARLNLTHAGLGGFPRPLLSPEQHRRFIDLNGEIGRLTAKARSRRKADLAVRDATLAALEQAKRQRDAVFGLCGAEPPPVSPCRPG